MAKPGRKGIQRVLYATKYSWLGLKAAFRKEAAFRQELALVALLAPLGMWLGETGVQRALLVSSLLLVIVIELLNSALEAVVDRFGDEWHKLSGRAKDMGSAAVFVGLLNVGVVWLFVLFDRFA
jgi:diacylglycerol kinase (ATP)